VPKSGEIRQPPRPSFPPSVIPAKAGIHLLPTLFVLLSHSKIDNMDSRFRGNDYGKMDSQGADASAPYSGNDEDGH